MDRRQFFKASAGISTVAAGLAVPKIARAAVPFGDGKPGPGVTWNQPRLAENPAAFPSGASFDYLVIGSGYGGSVNAARIAQKFANEIKAGTVSLAILERGKEWIPGSFPQTFQGAVDETSRTRNVLLDDVLGEVVGEPVLKNRLGLLDFHFHDQYDALVGQGLGGGSLINGNVAIEPDSDLFDEKLPSGVYRWPAEIRQEYTAGGMTPYFNRVRTTLDVQQIPHATFDELPKKSQKLIEDTNALGGLPGYLDIAVNFKPDGTPSIAGVPRNACRYCGDCVTGCNWGAKQTLYMNYLPLAKQSGAKIYTQVKAMGITKRGPNDYKIDLQVTPDASKPNNFHSDVVYAKNVIVSCGTLGSTELMLRSSTPAYGLKISAATGNRMSANGDSLGLSYDTKVECDSVGFGTRGGDRAKIRAGTCMEMMDDGRVEKVADGSFQKKPLRERFLIQHGVIPSAIVPTVARALVFQKVGPDSLKDLFGAKADGALNKSMIYLGMGHDDADGQGVLNKNNELDVKWPGVQNENAITIIRERMQNHADINHGKFALANPLQIIMNHLMTVHTLGGCVMSDSRDNGVVNHRGQVFDSANSDATAVHEGLYIADGSIIPDSLGVNPFLTISAVSERISDFIVGTRTV